MIERVQRPSARTSRSESGRTTRRSGAVPACPRSPTGSAGSRSARRCSSTRGELHEFADSGQGRRAGVRGAARHGRVEPRPEVIRRSYGEVPGGMRLHVLDSTDRRDPGRGAAGGPRQDPVHRLLEVGRHHRDALAHALLLRAHGRRRLALLRGHRPGQPTGRAGARARLPARVRERPRDRRPLLGALVLRPRAGRVRRREHRGHAPPGAGGRAELRAVRLPGRTRACGSAA